MVIILKTTTACNGTCVYCSSHAAGPQAISLETMRALFRFVASYLSSRPGEELKLILHGGEPLLLPASFFESVLGLRDEILGPLRTRFRCALQSNLTLLTKRKARALTELVDQAIGTSYDFWGDVRGIRGHASLEERWYGGLELARRHGFKVGVVYVVHRRSLEHLPNLYHFFRNHPLVGSVRFNPLYAEGKGVQAVSMGLGLTPRQWGEFLIGLWRLWERDRFRPRIAPLLEWHAAHLRGEFQQLCCNHSGRCSETHLGVDPEGAVYNCGRWSDTRQYSFGNLQRDALEAILASPERALLAGRAPKLHQGACSSCVWWDYCHGGCPNDAYLEQRDLFAPTKWCAGNRLFFEECLRPHAPPRRRSGETRGARP